MYIAVTKNSAMKTISHLLLCLLILHLSVNQSFSQEVLPFKKELRLQAHQLTNADLFHISKQLENVNGVYFWEYRSAEEILLISYQSKKIQDTSLFSLLGSFADKIAFSGNSSVNQVIDIEMQQPPVERQPYQVKMSLLQSLIAVNNDYLNEVKPVVVQARIRNQPAVHTTYIKMNLLESIVSTSHAQSQEIQPVIIPSITWAQYGTGSNFNTRCTIPLMVSRNISSVEFLKAEATVIPVMLTMSENTSAGRSNINLSEMGETGGSSVSLKNSKPVINTEADNGSAENLAEECISRITPPLEKIIELQYLGYDVNEETLQFISVQNKSQLSVNPGSEDNPVEIILMNKEVQSVQHIPGKKDLLIQTDELTNYDVYRISKKLETLEGVSFWGYHADEQTLMISYEPEKIRDSSVILSLIGDINKETCLKELTSETFYAFIERTSKVAK